MSSFKTLFNEASAPSRTNRRYPVVGPRIPVELSPFTSRLVNDRGTGRISRHAIAKGINTMADYRVKGSRFHAANPSFSTPSGNPVTGTIKSDLPDIPPPNFVN